MIEYLFDPEISEILAELESGSKESSYLASKSKISEDVLKNKLSYLLKYDFVRQTNEDGKIVYTADAEKLGKVMENNSNFDTGQQYGNLGRRSLSFKAGNINLKCGNSECDKFLIKGLANKFQFTDYYVQCIYCRKWNYLPEPLESDLPI